VKKTKLFSCLFLHSLLVDLSKTIAGKEGNQYMGLGREVVTNSYKSKNSYISLLFLFHNAGQNGSNRWR
jgi:hypothetical protein